jgi:3',5'-cyclic AMP phosphodiesterase CpdA
VLTFHHPIYSTAKGRDNKKLREAWQPVFDRYRVDLVLQGHDHSYGRSGLVVGENLPTGASARDPNAGTVYVVSVSGPKLYSLDPEPWMKSSAQDKQLYQVITVDGDHLRYEARTATGELYDRFELRKRDGQRNQILEADEIGEPPAGSAGGSPWSGAIGVLVGVALTLAALTLLRRRSALAPPPPPSGPGA